MAGDTDAGDLPHDHKQVRGEPTLGAIACGEKYPYSPHNITVNILDDAAIDCYILRIRCGE
jgi:hypothetical protein